MVFQIKHKKYIIYKGIHKHKNLPKKLALSIKNSQESLSSTHNSDTIYIIINSDIIDYTYTLNSIEYIL